MLGIYSASKHTVESLTVTAAKDKITVNAYYPGVAGTTMWERIDAGMVEYAGAKPGESFKKYAVGILMGRPEEPEDVAGLVHYLVFGL